MSVNLLKNDSIKGRSYVATSKEVDSTGASFKDSSSACRITKINYTGCPQKGVTPSLRTCENSIFKYDRGVLSTAYPIRSLHTLSFASSIEQQEQDDPELNSN